jgi:hypothetical protein
MSSSIIDLLLKNVALLDVSLAILMKHFHSVYVPGIGLAAEHCVHFGSRCKGSAA